MAGVNHNAKFVEHFHGLAIPFVGRFPKKAAAPIVNEDNWRPWLVYLMVTEGQEYIEQGIGAYEKGRLNRKFAHLDRQAQKLGFQLVPKTQGEEKQNPMPSIA